MRYWTLDVDVRKMSALVFFWQFEELFFDYNFRIRFISSYKHKITNISTCHDSERNSIQFSLITMKHLFTIGMKIIK